MRGYPLIYNTMVLIGRPLKMSSNHNCNVHIFFFFCDSMCMSRMLKKYIIEQKHKASTLGMEHSLLARP